MSAVPGKVHTVTKTEVEQTKKTLNGAVLNSMNLRGAELSDGNFISANLTSADLSTANCQAADFGKANLSQVNFTGANLRYAQFNETDLSGVNLTAADLTGASLYKANLRLATFTELELREVGTLAGADLQCANLRGARFARCNLSEACLWLTNLEGANLREANLSRADLWGANLTSADLSAADLSGATLIHTNLERATLSNCNIYGISAWNITGEPKDQSNLIITSHDTLQDAAIGASGVTITVDNIEVAQFVHLLMTRQKLRTVLDTITSKLVLILGRFVPPVRKAVLLAIADEVRRHNLLPIIFDFDGSPGRDITETIRIFASLSLFVIVDLTNPRSAPLELQAAVPHCKVPFVPIIHEDEEPFSMFKDLSTYPWMLTPIISYSSPATLARMFNEVILNRAWKKHQDLQEMKAQEVATVSWRDFLEVSPGEQ
jgi:uncharacterized protein YjbI with pentapeptide repeats